MSTNSRCGARSGLDSDRARLRSKLFAYSRHERTPCFASMLYVQSGFAPSVRLEAELDRAKIVDAKDIPANVITMRSTVRLKDLVSGEENIQEKIKIQRRRRRKL